MLIIFLANVLFVFSGLFAEVKTAESNSQNLSTAIFSGGCFWCMQPPFDKLEGVAYTKAGYTGGQVKNPTYEQVSAGSTGHRESIEVFYDPHIITYKKLLEVFWKNIDPLDGNGQFCDKGDQYRSAIYYTNEEEKKAAEESKKQLIQSGKFKEIYTQILPATEFYDAEDYHQEYYKKNPIRYKFYRFMCGRDKRLEELWGVKEVYH